MGFDQQESGRERCCPARSQACWSVLSCYAHRGGAEKWSDFGESPAGPNIGERMTERKFQDSRSEMIRVSHIFMSYFRLGGVHSRLRLHHQVDRSLGIDSSFVITSEMQERPQKEPRIYFLGTDGDSTIRLLRHRFKVALDRTRPEVMIYHFGGEDLAHLVDCDVDSRCILDLTMNSPDLGPWLEANGHLFDGVLSVSQSACEIARVALPHLAPSRIRWWPQPIYPPLDRLSAKSRSGQPLVIGYAGRMVRSAKRVDRIPRICRLLDERNVPYRFEFLGDGPERAQLERQLGGSPKFVFHGIREGEDYWRITTGWDVSLLVSDFEGGPLTILEGMGCGVIPVVPRIQSQSSAYADLIDPSLCYEAGDLSGAAEAIERLASLPEQALKKLRKRCRDLVEPHVGGAAYWETFQQFTHAIRNLPRISYASKSWDGRFDDIPFRWFYRIRWFRRAVVRLRQRLVAPFGNSAAAESSKKGFQ